MQGSDDRHGSRQAQQEHCGCCIGSSQVPAGGIVQPGVEEGVDSQAGVLIPEILSAVRPAVCGIVVEYGAQVDVTQFERVARDRASRVRFNGADGSVIAHRVERPPAVNQFEFPAGKSTPNDRPVIS